MAHTGLARGLLIPKAKLRPGRIWVALGSKALQSRHVSIQAINGNRQRTDAHATLFIGSSGLSNAAHPHRPISRDTHGLSRCPTRQCEQRFGSLRSTTRREPPRAATLNRRVPTDSHRLRHSNRCSVHRRDSASEAAPRISPRYRRASRASRVPRSFPPPARRCASRS